MVKHCINIATTHLAKETQMLDQLKAKHFKEFIIAEKDYRSSGRLDINFLEYLKENNIL